MSRSRSIAISAAVGCIAAVMTAGVAFAQDRGMGDGFGRRHRGGGMFFFLPLLVLAAIAVLAVMLWRSRNPVSPIVTSPPASPTLNAQTILADRLARGEISPDDYRSAITVLHETPPPPPAAS
jgi:putative membrane protein